MTSQNNPGTSAPQASRFFVTTRWTRVLAAQGNSPEAKLALGELCDAYWTPVFRFLRREGRDDETARELTQEFFARVLASDGFASARPERGRFRSYLLGAVKHFLGDMRAQASAQKRGGGEAAHVPMETMEEGDNARLEEGMSVAQACDAYFDQQWALLLMERSLGRLEGELKESGKEAHFEVLKPWLEGDPVNLTQAEAGRQLGLSEGAVKVSVHRMRKRLGEIVRLEVEQTLSEPSEMQAELNYLVEALSN
jgi:RNA polymerase sigma factor (sigma-70 family)